jgi:ribonuclease D
MPRTQELSKPLLAAAGVGDVAVAKLRELPAEYRRLQRQARSLDTNALRVAVEDYTTRVAGTAITTYDDLVVRGEKLVTSIRRQQASKDLVATATTARRSAKATGTTARKNAAQTKSRAKSTTTSARKTAKAAGKAASAGAGKVG